VLSKPPEQRGASLGGFSVKLYDPEFVAQRREIGSFFFNEVGGGPQGRARRHSRSQWLV